MNIYYQVSVCGEDEKMEMKLCIALFILGLVSTVLGEFFLQMKQEVESKLFEFRFMRKY